MQTTTVPLAGWLQKGSHPPAFSEHVHEETLVKEATLQTLIIARTLLEEAERHCALGDRYMATAGLIVLQDAAELVFLAVLIEKGVDEERSIEKFTFDEMISALGQLKIKVPKSGTLKAMNKLRVAAKHYGQVMEPRTVQGHLNAVKLALNAVLVAGIGKPLRDVFLTELIEEVFSRPQLDDAAACLAKGEYMQALNSTRKAFFLEFEKDYCIYQYRNTPSSDPFRGGLGAIIGGGSKANDRLKNADWIGENVHTPFDFVQINHERWRIDALEWGINTQTLNNIQRLTPEVIQLEWQGEWLVRYPAAYIANSATKENASSCLDLTIEVIRRKQDHFRAVRFASNDKPFDTPPAYVGQPLYQKPDFGSKLVRHLAADDKYLVHEVLSGFPPAKTFYKIDCFATDGKTVSGYIERLQEAALGEGTAEATDGSTDRGVLIHSRIRNPSKVPH